MKRNVGRKWVELIIALALPLAVGGLAGWATSGDVESWYPMLEKPDWTPPGWVFGPVWTVLYLLMGAASWLVWRSPVNSSQKRKVLGLYGLQLAFNGFWSLLFFEFHRIGWALVEIIVLDLLIIYTAALFYVSRRLAGLLMVPYAVWVTYAATLNAGILVLN